MDHIMNLHPRRTAVPSPATVGLQAARPASAAPGMQPLRECDCPPQVIMCVHYGAERVVLAKAQPPLCDLHTGYSVGLVEGSPNSQWWCCAIPTWEKAKDIRAWITSYNAALAAFRDAEARLLERA